MPDKALNPTQIDDLRIIAGLMIPAGDEFDVPGADDPRIQADILATLGRDAESMAEALDLLARLAGRPLADLDPDQRETAATELRTRGGPAVATLTRVILQCYYRDDRVVRSLGLEPRLPIRRGTFWRMGIGRCWTLFGRARRCGVGHSFRGRLGGKAHARQHDDPNKRQSR